MSVLAQLPTAAVAAAAAAQRRHSGGIQPITIRPFDACRSTASVPNCFLRIPWRLPVAALPCRKLSVAQGAQPLLACR